MKIYELASSYDNLADAFKTEAIKTLQSSLGRVEHCLNQLSDEDVWHHPKPEMNAIGNLILHSCGNITQWIIHGCTDQPFARHRQSEFDHRDPIPVKTLLTQLQTTITAACDTIHSFTEPELTASHRIQGFDTTTLTAVMHAVTHFEGHAQEIIYITRLRLGDQYQFMWQPENKEQGA